MRSLLFVLSAASFVLGCLVLSVSKSAIHELITIGLFISASVFFSSAAIVSVLVDIRDWLKEQDELRLLSSVHEMNPRER